MALAGHMSKHYMTGNYARIIPSFHPFSKALLFLGIMLLALTAASMVFQALLFLLLAGFCCWGKIPFFLLARRMVIPLCIVLGLLLLKGFQLGENEIISLTIFSRQLAFYEEGFYMGLFLGLRVINAVTAVILFSLVTTFQEMLALAGSFKIPPALVELMIYAFNFSFNLKEEAVRISSAQKLRLGYADRWRLLSSYGTLGGMIFIRAYDRARKINRAQQLRCYQGSLHLPRTVPLKGDDYRHLLFILPGLTLLGVFSWLLGAGLLF